MISLLILMVLLQELRKPWKDTLSLSPLIEAEAEILLALSQNIREKDR
jgi:hypothetical protein